MNLDPKIVAAIIVASISFLLFVLKDIGLDLYNRFKSERRSKKVAFQIYAIPLLSSIEAILRRLEEIIELRGHYLLDSSPKNKFNTYKLISTNYRFCTLLAWLRALKIEFDKTDLKQISKYNSIDNAILKVESALADGQSMEIQIFVELSNLWNYNYSRLNKKQKRIIGIEVENLIYAAVYPNAKELARELNQPKQIELLQNISRTIANYLQVEECSNESINSTCERAIIEISLTENWIYRDWQSAIGNIMLIETTESHRRFDVLGFDEYEEIFLSNENKWVNRVKGLFSNLNFQTNHKYDARLKQIKYFYCALVNLKESIYISELAQGIINEKDLFRQIEVALKYKD